MAILHQATLSPTKLEFVTEWLDDMGFGTGPVTLIGGYRFDDPEGRVGVEGLIARRGDEYFQLPVTYRDAPLEVGCAHLITTMQHSVLGQRWVYGASGDPVAVGCYLRALSGEQEQAGLEVYDADENLVEVRTPPIVVHVENPGAVEPGDLGILRRLNLDADLGHAVPTLVAEWAGDHSADVAIGA